VADWQHFDHHADTYERGRPPYPDALWARIDELGVLAPGRRALDLGAGTGQATERLVSAGMQVTAVEPGLRLASRLRVRFPGVSVLETTAERADLDADAYDVAVTATSIHWMDLRVVLPKLHRTLVPGGHLLVWRNAFGDPLVQTPFRRRVAEITSRRAGAPRPGLTETDTQGWVAALTAGGYFRSLLSEDFRWTIRMDAEAIRDLFLTFSNWSPTEVEAAAQAVRDLGGEVEEHYITPLIVLIRA
jgi:SAM-dependent methyltransferase